MQFQETSPYTIYSSVPAQRGINVDPWEKLYHYWLSKNVGDRPPSLADVDPIVDIPRLVSNLIVIRALSDGYIYQIIGTQIVERHGLGLTGKLLGSSGAAQSAIAIWRSAVEFADREQKPKLLVARYPSSENATNIILFLPLSDRDGHTTHVLVGSFYDGYVCPGAIFGEMLAEEIEL